MRFLVLILTAWLAASPLMAANPDENPCIAASAQRLPAIPSLQVVGVSVKNAQDRKAPGMILVSFDLKLANAAFRYTYVCAKASDGSYLANLGSVE